jgi:uncharacterized membrane protein
VAMLTAWRFETADGADTAAKVLQELAREQVVVVHDAATVSWPEGEMKPRTQLLHSLTGTGAMGGSFWGLLFGLIFFVPLLGAAIGAASGALAGSLRDVGIDDSFVNRVRDRVTPGTSALFLMCSDALVDQVKDAFAGGAPSELLYTHLTQDQEDALRQVFTES